MFQPPKMYINSFFIDITDSNEIMDMKGLWNIHKVLYKYKESQLLY